MKEAAAPAGLIGTRVFPRSHPPALALGLTPFPASLLSAPWMPPAASFF